MSQPEDPKYSSKTYDPERLRHHLEEHLAVLARAAHALGAAAEHLRNARLNDYGQAALDVRSAALVAMHAALSVHQLVGGYELAHWLTEAKCE